MLRTISSLLVVIVFSLCVGQAYADGPTRTEIIKHIRDNTNIQGSSLVLNVEDGVVTVNGSGQSALELATLEREIKKVPGVTQVYINASN